MTSFRQHCGEISKVVLGLIGLFFALGAISQTSSAHDWRYTVRPNDTLSSLARQYLQPSVTWQ